MPNALEPGRGAREIKIEGDSGPEKPSPLYKKTKGGDRSHTPAVHLVGAASSTLSHPRVSTASAEYNGHALRSKHLIWTKPKVVLLLKTMMKMSFVDDELSENIELCLDKDYRTVYKVPWRGSAKSLVSEDEKDRRIRELTI
ncbi:LOW QUALITY PROTEIN: hypothetical protein NC653_007722 [Populus alba x Populus x berolinensis]|uniref:Uncharacterized protein n=1 Tax=Populus alba x Populus x berolinensis TaxID=444605 RepID=A0AAD6RIS2_9ROSI|nr:LOW QUALITY PROTEIN: hypothetical protein NC653_007722 [Populus alba x Populus x berolinensis]